MTPDEIVLTLPRRRSFYDVAHLVVGGLAVRLDLTVDNLSDLQLALDGLLPRDEADGDVTVVLRPADGELAGRIGPFRADALRRELEREGGGYGTQLVLETVFQSYRIDEKDGEAWLAFSMELGSKDGDEGG